MTPQCRNYRIRKCDIMSTDFNIKLTWAVYRVTELFPKEAGLKRDIRQTADEILVSLLTDQNEHLACLIKTLQDYFQQAQAQNWVDTRNFSVLRWEYERIAKLSSQESGALRSHGSSFAKASEDSPSLPDLLGNDGVSWRRRGKTVEKPRTTQKRKQRILETLAKNNKIKVGDLIKIFPATNRRTILRDLEDFSQTGLIVKTGNGRGACYILRNATL